MDKRFPGRWLQLLLVGIAIASLMLWLNVAPAAIANRLTVTVNYAKSGHTLELLPDLGSEISTTTIRLAAIEAPDRDQNPWGDASRECLSDLENEIIYVEPVDSSPDAYNRLWAYSWLGSESINRRSLAEGCAYLTAPDQSQSPQYQSFLYAQERARLLGLGIWNPMLPLRETAETFRERSPSP
ncbi:MAG: thermonuclease family protein [Leptolyngbyaceae cyanobacterium]